MSSSLESFLKWVLGGACSLVVLLLVGWGSWMVQRFDRIEDKTEERSKAIMERIVSIEQKIHNLQLQIALENDHPLVVATGPRE